MSGHNLLINHENMHNSPAFVITNSPKTKRISKTSYEIVCQHLRVYYAPLKIIIVLLLLKIFKTSQPSAKAKMAKINSETLLRGDY